MRKTLLLFGFIFVLCVVPLTASEIYVTYIIGDCMIDVEGNGKWQDPLIDMELKESSIIRTDFNGEIELEIDGNAVSIGPNSYMKISSLLEKVSEKRKMRWLKKATKYAKVVKKSDDKWSETALAGVRGDRAEKGELEWVEDFEDDEYQRGMELFEEGSYTTAIKIFAKIIEEDGIDTQGGEASYYLGVSLFNSLRYKDALPYLVESIKNKGTSFYESALMNYAFTQYFLRNYREAIEGFTSYTEDFSEGDFVPYSFLMLGKCYKDMGLKKEARVYFTRVEQEFSDSDVYMDALNEMKDL
ncbi:MAG: tetratricopeptide repeat protein [Spirochaetota bacterium]|nr:MAG: tetratricopeptide repeat protein [Spirochaetota bacterium]